MKAYISTDSKVVMSLKGSELNTIVNSINGYLQANEGSYRRPAKALPGDLDAQMHHAVLDSIPLKATDLDQITLERHISIPQAYAIMLALYLDLDKVKGSVSLYLALERALTHRV